MLTNNCFTLMYALRPSTWIPRWVASVTHYLMLITNDSLSQKLVYALKLSIWRMKARRHIHRTSLYVFIINLESNSKANHTKFCLPLKVHWCSSASRSVWCCQLAVECQLSTDRLLHRVAALQSCIIFIYTIMYTCQSGITNTHIIANAGCTKINTVFMGTQTGTHDCSQALQFFAR